MDKHFQKHPVGKSGGWVYPAPFFWCSQKNGAGFTTIEISITVGVLGLLALAFFGFQHNLLQFNQLIGGGLSRQTQMRKLFREFTQEARSASPSNAGGYPIEQAGAGSFTFFSDRDSDGRMERIRYFVDGFTLKKSIITPSGSPLTYNTVNEVITDKVSDLTNTDIFSYYDADFDGTGAPLSQPVIASQVRLVAIKVVSDPNGPKPPAPAEFSAQVTVRNVR